MSCLHYVMQSNAYAAAELSRRMDEFVDKLLNTGGCLAMGRAPRKL